MPGLDDEFRYERHRRRLWLAVVFVIALAMSLLGLIFVPFHKVSQELQFPHGSSASSELSIPQAGWVTVTFEVADRAPALVDTTSPSGWSLWIRGPSGTMFNESNTPADSYSFWTWSGTYHYGAGYSGGGSGAIGVWVNATWGAL